jgi:hypothetical protein
VGDKRNEWSILSVHIFGRGKKKREKNEYLANSEVNSSTTERETAAKRSRSARVLWMFYTKSVQTYFVPDAVLICTTDLSQLTISVTIQFFLTFMDPCGIVRIF